MARRCLCVFLVLASLGFASARASAHVSSGSAANLHDGDNQDETDQEGSGDSGDAVSGQVLGVTSSGDASVDATNLTQDSSATSGDADGSNLATSFTGLAGGGVHVADVTSGSSGNLQEGDNSNEGTQHASVLSGDAVAGQVSGVVTAPGGVTDLVLHNTTIHARATSGDAEFTNRWLSLVGLLGGGGGLPALVISDDATGEPGTLTFVVSVIRSATGQSSARGPAVADGAITVSAKTKDGSAMAEGQPGDYDPVETTVTIPAGGSTSITVNVNNDNECESIERLTMNLSGASGATIADGVGVGSIDEGKDC